MDSSLNSVRGLLHQHYPKVDSDKTTSQRTTRTEAEGQALDENGESDEDAEVCTHIGGATAKDKKERDEHEMDDETVTAAVTVHQAASQTLDFLQPFLEEIHTEHMSMV